MPDSILLLLFFGQMGGEAGADILGGGSPVSQLKLWREESAESTTNMGGGVIPYTSGLAWWRQRPSALATRPLSIYVGSKHSRCGDNRESL